MDAGIRGSFQMMCRAVSGGWEGMATALEMSVPALKNRVYELKGQQPTVGLAMQMQDLSQTTYFAEAVARASGGVFILLPQVDDLGNADIQEKYVELMDRVGALAREYRDATADNHVDRHERRVLNLLGNEICQLVTQINQLTFRIFSSEDNSNGN